MDSVTGPAGVFAILAALHYRAATGRGQVIELAQSENVLTELGDVFLDLQDAAEERRRVGGPYPRRAPQGLYLCGDESLLALTVADDEAWLSLTDVLGRCDLAEDERLLEAAGRRAAHRRDRSRHSRLDRHRDGERGVRGTPAGRRRAAPYLDEASFSTDSQVEAREWIRPLPSSDVGDFGHLGHAFRGIPLALGSAVPRGSVGTTSTSSRTSSA